MYINPHKCNENFIELSSENPFFKNYIEHKIFMAYKLISNILLVHLQISDLLIKSK